MCENKQKLSQRIGRYMKNLVKALFGLDPYREELVQAKEQLLKAAKNLSDMQDQLYAALDRWDGCQLELVDVKRELEDTKRALAEAECTSSCKHLKSMQGLEFQERLERVKHEYQQRIEEYNEEIDKLKNRK